MRASTKVYFWLISSTDNYLSIKVYMGDGYIFTRIIEADNITIPVINELYYNVVLGHFSVSIIFRLHLPNRAHLASIVVMYCTPHRNLLECSINYLFKKTNQHSTYELVGDAHEKKFLGGGNIHFNFNQDMGLILFYSRSIKFLKEMNHVSIFL